MHSQMVLRDNICFRVYHRESINSSENVYECDSNFCDQELSTVHSYSYRKLIN